MSLQLKIEIAGQSQQTVPLQNFPSVVGSLLSNQVVIRASGVEPIHCLLEEDAGIISVTDLGSGTGVLVNGQSLDVQSPIKVGDRLQIGTAVLTLEAAPVPATVYSPPLNVRGELPPPPPPAAIVPQVVRVNPQSSPANLTESQTQPVTKSRPETLEPVSPTQRSSGVPESESKQRADDRSSEQLFSPRRAKPSGDVLECVAYWDDTVLEVDLFHPSFKGYENVTIGNPAHTHFIAAGEANIDKHVLASVDAAGYKVRLLEGMDARIRKAGKVESAHGPGSHRLGPRDLIHIKYGPVKYFLLFVRPPHLDIRRTGIRDPILLLLSSIAALIYLAIIPAMWLANPVLEEDPNDDVVMLVQLPKKEEKPVTPPTPKPKVTVEEVKVEPPKKTPPPPTPKPVKAAKAVEVEMPKQQKPVEKPTTKPEQNNTANENLKKPAVVAPKPQEQQIAGKSAENNPNKSQGMATTGAKNPDFKKPGPPNNNPSPKSGGAVGSGMGQKGGERKGTQGASQMGVEGPKNNQASGVNLSKLGLGVGKILNDTGPGAIATNFKNSAGGAGGGSGSGSRNYGFGGVGNSSSLGLAGSGGAVNNFGSGSGGFGGGQGGTGGLGGAGIGKGFGAGDGRGRANVSIPAAGPEVSGGLSRQEILVVIQANLNQIRHCYEQLLQRSPSASGKLTVAFTIGGDGGVTTASISDSSITDSIMRGCVTGRVQRWNFPKPRGATSVDVKYPFVFSPL